MICGWQDDVVRQLRVQLHLALQVQQPPSFYEIHDRRYVVAIHCIFQSNHLENQKVNVHVVISDIDILKRYDGYKVPDEFSLQVVHRDLLYLIQWARRAIRCNFPKELEDYFYYMDGFEHNDGDLCFSVL